MFTGSAVVLMSYHKPNMEVFFKNIKVTLVSEQETLNPDNISEATDAEIGKTYVVKVVFSDDFEVK